MTTAPYAPEQRPSLTLVKDTPEPTAGAVVEQHDTAPARPAWIHSSRALAEQTATIARRAYLPQAARGYARLGRRWLDAWRDDHPQMIATARQALRDAVETT
ncbi:hypothetical protein LUW77_03390 [Streptomyces radiopugnans]|nr:hypothetical protein LUW77_03390 [Streptomyces radiopugnans]